MCKKSRTGGLSPHLGTVEPAYVQMCLGICVSGPEFGARRRLLYTDSMLRVLCNRAMVFGVTGNGVCE